MVEKIEERRPPTVYTDGSSILGKIGASFVLPSGSEGRYLGTENEYTVYSAELCGIYEALRAISYTYTGIPNQSSKVLHIFTDNQAAIQVVQDPASHIRSGQIIIKGIIQCLDFLREKGTRVVVHWIPAHEGFPGNEQADQEAKQATGWRLQDGIEVDTSNPGPKAYHTGYQLTVKVKRAIKQYYLSQWQCQWSQADHGADLRRICPTPTKKILTVHRGASRWQSSWRESKPSRRLRAPVVVKEASTVLSSPESALPLDVFLLESSGPSLGARGIIFGPGLIGNPNKAN